MDLAAFQSDNVPASYLIKCVRHIKTQWDVIWRKHAKVNLTNVVILQQQQSAIIS